MGKFKRIGIILTGLFLLSGVVFLLNPNSRTQDTSAPIVNSQLDTKEKSDKVSYRGEKRRSALEILEEKHEVEIGSSGLVVSIDGREAQNSLKEYWAFYVNGEYAPIGPAEYITNDEDQIEWKIETY